MVRGDFPLWRCKAILVEWRTVIFNTNRRLQMSVQQPVLTPPHGGETVTSSGGSSVEMKVETSQSGAAYAAVLLTQRAGEHRGLHVHSREDELVYVLQG